MAIIMMQRVLPEKSKYNDVDVSRKYQADVSSSSGDSDIIMLPLQVETVCFTFDPGDGSGTVYITSEKRAKVEIEAAGGAPVKWEPFTSAPTSDAQFDETEAGITAIKCSRATGSGVYMNVESGVVRNTD